MEKSWHDRYDNARKEYVVAESQYRLADDILARATASLNMAQSNLNRLFHERAEQVNAQ